MSNGAELSLACHGTLGGGLLGELVLGTRPHTMLPVKGHRDGVGAASSAQRSILGAATIGPCGGAAVGSAGESSQAELAQWELEKSHRFPIRCLVPSKRQAALSN